MRVARGQCHSIAESLTSRSIERARGQASRVDAFIDARRQRAEALSHSSSAFGRPFAILFVTFAMTLLMLRVEGMISMHVVVGGMLLLPVLAACCAVPVARLIERQFDERHRRELAESQRQRQEANLRLLVLQAQIEPHFLFNTLASLRALLREDIDKAEGLVDALVSHLRAVLPMIRSDVGVSTLADQLAICASYLDLMSIRLDGRLSYQIDVPASLEDAVMPPLVLLTLVENAIKHGIEPKAGDGCIRVEVRGSVEPSGTRIIVAVMDDGVGLSHAPHGGLGLRNLREQLALSYGDRASLSLVSPASGGTTAALCIPYELLQAPT